MSISGLSVGTMKMVKLSDDEKLEKISRILKGAEKPLLDRVYNLIVTLENEAKKVDGFMVIFSNEQRQVYEDKKGLFYKGSSPKAKNAYLKDGRKDIKELHTAFLAKRSDDLQKKTIIELQRAENLKRQSTQSENIMLDPMFDDDVSELDSTTLSQHAAYINQEMDSVFNAISLEDERKPSPEELTAMESEEKNTK